MRNPLGTPPAPRPEKAAVLLAVVALSAGAVAPAWGQARLNAPATPCAQVRAMVAQNWSMVIQTGPYLYDRYSVSCPGGHEPAYLRTRDDPRCYVGYRCTQRND